MREGQYVAVATADKVTRIDTFNGIYGLSRNMAGSFLILAGTALGYGFQHACQHFDGQLWVTALEVAGLLLCAGVMLYRMKRFGKNYARELFLQFLELPLPTALTSSQ